MILFYDSVSLEGRSASTLSPGLLIIMTGKFGMLYEERPLIRDRLLLCKNKYLNKYKATSLN